MKLRNSGTKLKPIKLRITTDGQFFWILIRSSTSKMLNGRTRTTLGTAFHWSISADFGEPSASITLTKTSRSLSAEKLDLDHYLTTSQAQQLMQMCNRNLEHYQYCLTMLNVSRTHVAFGSVPLVLWDSSTVNLEMIWRWPVECSRKRICSLTESDNRSINCISWFSELHFWLEDTVVL